MDLRTFRNQFVNAGVVTDDIPVIFRTPNCSAYYNVNCHIVNVDNKEHLMIDLVDNSDKGSDFDLDKTRHPVEGDIQLALDVTIARQNVQIYNHSNYFQFKEIDYMIICASKNGFEYYEATFVESFHYVDKGGKEIRASELVDRINRHYSALGFDVCVDKTKDVYKVLIQW